MPTIDNNKLESESLVPNGVRLKPLIPVTPTILTIAGSDTSCGAGIQADLKTIHANGGYAFTVTTALTAQNSMGVSSVNVVDSRVVQAQIEAILSDVNIDALKIGMLGSLDIVKVVIEAIRKYNIKNIVLDTVIISSSGKRLLDIEALELFIYELIPLVDVITPNLLEINSLTNMNFRGLDSEYEAIFYSISKLNCKSVLIKGGHFQDISTSTDILIDKNSKISKFSSKRVLTNHTHGTGCTLSSAIATYLAKGYTLIKSIEFAKKYLTNRLSNSSNLNFNYKFKIEERTENINHY